MSAALSISRPDDSYFNLAQRYSTATKDLVLDGDTITQSPDAVSVMLDMADRLIKAGGNGWVFVFADGSALATSNRSDMIWPRWGG
jgi:hypothetical protein